MQTITPYLGLDVHKDSITTITIAIAEPKRDARTIARLLRAGELTAV